MKIKKHIGIVEKTGQYTNEMCALFAPVLTAAQILALRMFSHAILPWVRKLHSFNRPKSHGATQHAR